MCTYIRVICAKTPLYMYLIFCVIFSLIKFDIYVTVLAINVCEIIVFQTFVIVILINY